MDYFKIGFLVFSLFLTCFGGKDLKTIKSAFELHEHLLTNYSSDVRPVNDDNAITEIRVISFLIQVFRLDEVSGELVTSMGLSFTWHDENFQWKPDDFEGRYKMEIDVTKIWSPALKLLSPSQKAERLGKEGDKAIVYSYGHVTMTVNDIFYTSCAVQITYFPFDTQLCEIWFANPEYGKLLNFTPNSPVMDTSLFFDSPIWKVKETTAKSVSTTYINNFVCGILLERRATFYVLNLLTPIIMLMILNSMVFALPAESGERVGFCVTLLLSVAVYMTIISEKLPNSSKHAPILTYVLVAYLAQSAFICIKTIIGLRMYHHDERVPVSRTLALVVRCMKCCFCFCGSNKQKERKEQCKESSKSNEIFSVLENNIDISDNIVEDHEITWKTVASTFDTIFLISNILQCVIITIVYFCLVYVRPF